MSEDRAAHWEGVYTRKAVDQVSWYRPHLERSLEAVARAGLGPDAALIDVGGGASTFVDDLLDRGFKHVTVVDLSATALEVARKRLGARAAQVTWLVGDITTLQLPRAAYDFWHDRAVFHFLREPADRARYVEAVRHSVKPGGHVVVATFGPHGPQKCSDLEVQRYSGEQLHAEFGPRFAKLSEATELHDTPSGKQQEFTWCACRYVP